jgi:outer membrane receptor protein involved in Fe transport
VDGDNNISLNGQTNFKVLLNGRETAMFAQNVKEALKGFPGALITRIEVITTPSAKYDAEGVGGIINIITKKKVVGYNGSVNTYMMNTGWYNINANFSAKFGKLGMTLFYGAGGVNGVTGTSRMETKPLISNPPFSKRLLLGERKMTNFWNFGNLEMNYEADTLNTISAYANLNAGKNHNVLSQTITTSYPASDSTSYYNLDSRGEYPTTSLGADYIRKFRNNKEREFSIRLNHEFGSANTYLTSIMDYPAAYDRHMVNNSVASNRQYTIQSDYIHPLPRNQKLEVGIKAILRRASSDFESMIRTNTIEDYKLNQENTDNFNYLQDVYSFYGTYSFKVKKTTFRLGGRMEHTDVYGDFHSSSDKVEQGYNNLLPNLQVSSKLSEKLTLVLSYSDRLQRPYIYNLNPFKNNNDPLNISYGNPALEAQIVHSLSLQTRYAKGGTFAGITFGGSYSDNMIVQYASFNQFSGVTSTTSGNLGKEWQLSATGNVSTKINKDWNVFLNGNIRYNKVQNLKMATQINSGFSGNANLNTSYTFSKKLVASGYGGFYRNPVTIQTRYPLNLWYGVNAGYKFFKEKLTASLGIANFLQKERNFELTTQDPAFQYTSVSTMPFRGLSLSLTWTFGKMTENVSKKKGVTNDDIVTGTGN